LDFPSLDYRETSRRTQSSVNKPIPLWLRIAAWIAFAGWAGGIFYFSSLTGMEIAEFGITLSDKVEHFAAFMVGGILLALALRWSVAWPEKTVARFAIGVLVVYGALDEAHQLFTPHRSGADPYDWLADALGAMAGVVLFTMIYARLSRAHPPASARA
jgi:VanZ family protein